MVHNGLPAKRNRALSFRFFGIAMIIASTFLPGRATPTPLSTIRIEQILAQLPAVRAEVE